MTLLSANDMADLRADAELALSESCVVLRGTASADEFSAAGSVTWGTAATVACRVRSIGLGAGEVLNADLQVQMVQSFAVTLPYNADVRATDRIVYGGSTFEVMAVTAGAQTDDVVTRVLMSRSG